MLTELVCAIAVSIQLHEGQVRQQDNDEATAGRACLGGSGFVFQQQGYLACLIEGKVYHCLSPRYR